MSTKDDGGKAFPNLYVYTNDMGEVQSEAEDGMSLRDYFAAKAMQGWLAGDGGKSRLDAAMLSADALAKFAYSQADAMLEARKS